MLVNNAGYGLGGFFEDVFDGELRAQFETNFFGLAAVIRAFLFGMRERRHGRIVNVSSRSAAPIDFADVMMERGYTGYRAYSQSKLAQVMFTVDLAAELKAKGIVVQAVHPAAGMDTNMIASAGWTPRTSIDEGATAVMHVIATAAPSGSYFVGQTVGTPHAQASDADARRQLREVSRMLTGVSQLSEPRP